MFFDKNKDKGKNKEKNKNKDNRTFNILFIMALLLSMAISIYIDKHNHDNYINTSKTEDVSYNEFMNNIDDKKINEVNITDEWIIYTINDDEMTYKTRILDNDNLVEELHENNIDFKKVPNNSALKTLLSYIFSEFWPFIFFIFFVYILKNKIIPNNNRYEEYSPDKIKTRFTDIAGEDEAKDQLKDVIDFLKNSSKYTSIGAKIPKGILMIGPPGTGKTMLAKAVAGEAGVPFYYMTGSDFDEKYVGVGAERVVSLFKKAKETAPCIIFIDEIDSIAMRGRSNNSYDAQTINKLLSEMDGFDSDNNIVVIAATNRPDGLDTALLRPGRFDRKVYVNLPDFNERVEILKIHAQNIKINENVDFDIIGHATAGASGADLANIINEAAILAVKSGHEEVTQEELSEAVESVIAGQKKKKTVISMEEKKIVSYHEVGHAVVSTIMKNKMPVNKITIIPRTQGSLGYTMQVENEERFLSSRDDILQEITTLLGGRSAEEVFFNKVTTGASNDIERATDITRNMISLYGMSVSFDMMALGKEGNIYLNKNVSRSCSDNTYSLADKEILATIKACHKAAKQILTENKELVDEIAQTLLEKEIITGDEFMKIYRKYYPENDNLFEKNNYINEIEQNIMEELK